MTKKIDHIELRKHFIEVAYSTLQEVVSPTPYVNIVEGENVEVRFLDGKGELPTKNSTEVSVLDLQIPSMFLDNLRILQDGITGVGKTYTSDALFSTVLGDGYYTIRLGGGLLGASALEPFTTTTLENGVPKTRIDHEKCQRYGALFIDEINRGDSQEVFQVVDGKIYVNGDTGYLGLPIPGTNRLKKLALIAAMNPADAQHSSALELDIAGENRFLKFRFPNGVDEAGSSQLDKRVCDNLHIKFWDEVRKRTGLSGDWRELYPLITDSEQVRTELNGETREFIDVALGYVGKDPSATFSRNQKLMQAGRYSPRFAVVKNNDLERVLEAQKSLKQGFVRRDLEKINDLSLLLGFVKSMKNGTYDPQVSLNDVAASIGIILESKKITGADEGKLMALVNDSLKAYKEAREAANVPDDYGARQAIWQAAVYAGQEGGFEAYRNTLQKNIGALNTQARSTAGATIKSRLMADLVVLDHFSNYHEEEIGAALKQDQPLDACKEVYEKNKAGNSVYEHRLSSVVR